MREDEIRVRQPRAEVERPSIEGDDSRIRFAPRRVVERHETVVLPNDVVITVERCQTQKQEKRIGGVRDEPDDQKSGADAKREQACHQKTRTPQPFLAVEVGARECRADVWTVERQQPDPPQRHNRRAEREEAEDEQAQRRSTEEEGEIESAADDPAGCERTRVVHRVMIERVATQDTKDTKDTEEKLLRVLRGYFFMKVPSRNSA